MLPVSANLGREEKLAGRLQVSASSNYRDFLSPRSPAIQPERNSTGQHTLQLLYKLIIAYTTKQKHNPPPKKPKQNNWMALVSPTCAEVFKYCLCKPRKCARQIV